MTAHWEPMSLANSAESVKESNATPSSWTFTGTPVPFLAKIYQGFVHTLSGHRRQQHARRINVIDNCERETLQRHITRLLRRRRCDGEPRGQ